MAVAGGHVANSRCDGPRCGAAPVSLEVRSGFLQVHGRVMQDPASLTPLPWPDPETRTVSSGERREAQTGRGEGPRLFPPAWWGGVGGGGALTWGRGPARASTPLREKPCRGAGGLGGSARNPLQTPVARTHIPSGSLLQTTRRRRSRSHRSGFSETLKAIAAH